MDFQIFILINNLAFKNSVADLVGIFVTRWVIVILTTVAAIVVAKKGKVMTISAILALILVLAADRFLNLAFPVNRPFIENQVQLLVEKPADLSFPSTHAAISAAAAVFWFSHSKLLGVVGVILAILVGVSRIFVGVHWPSDVLGGWVLGVAVYITSVKLTNWFQSRKNGSET